MLDTLLGARLEVKRAQSRCAHAIFRAGIGANAATLLALVIGIGSGIAFARGAVSLAIVALAISAGFDAIDGTIARECAAPTAFGGVIDLCSDRVVITGIAWRVQRFISRRCCCSEAGT